jgi:hypothetical protein
LDRQVFRHLQQKVPRPHRVALLYSRLQQHDPPAVKGDRGIGQTITLGRGKADRTGGKGRHHAQAPWLLHAGIPCLLVSTHRIAGGFDAAAAIGEPHYSIICHGPSDIAGEAGRIRGKSLRSIKAEIAAPSCKDRVCAYIACPCQIINY